MLVSSKPIKRQIFFRSYYYPFKNWENYKEHYKWLTVEYGNKEKLSLLRHIFGHFDWKKAFEVEQKKMLNLIYSNIRDSMLRENHDYWNNTEMHADSVDDESRNEYWRLEGGR